MPKLTVFSPVRGRIVKGGRPKAKLKVTQRWEWLGERDGSSVVTTDADGRFSFPEVSVKRARTPKDVLLTQRIEVQSGDQTVSLWQLTREDLERNGELGGEAIELTADLDAPLREVKLPVGPDALSVISGVATFRHPYLERWERIRPLVTPDRVGTALQQYLGSREGAKRLATFFPAIGTMRRRVVEVVDVTDVKLDDGYLAAALEGGRYAVRRPPRYVALGTHARVRLKLDSGEVVPGGFFAWALFLPLDEAGTPKWEAHFADSWEVDTRDWIRRQARALLAEDKVAALVRGQLEAAPGEQVLRAVGGTSMKVKDVELSDVKVDGVKNDWASLHVLGVAKLTVGKRQERARFRGAVAVQLASLSAAKYRVAPAGGRSSFLAFTFGVTLQTDHAAYAAGEKIVLRFEVENLMGTPQRFLTWHTPFEGFANDYLEIRPVGGGEAVAYQGMLASRAPPGPDDYLTLEPGETASATIDVTQAYPVKAPGEYVLRYKPLTEVWAEETGFTIR